MRNLNKKEQLAYQLTKANNDFAKGKIDYVQLSHQMESINSDGKIHHLDPNEILCEAQNHPAKYSKMIEAGDNAA